jgi:hypothetical protein
MKCPACPAERTVDILQWIMPDNCSQCKASTEVQDRQQMERYKELYQLITTKGGTDMSNANFDYLSVWCAGQMNGVFGCK